MGGWLLAIICLLLATIARPQQAKYVYTVGGIFEQSEIKHQDSFRKAIEDINEQLKNDYENQNGDWIEFNWHIETIDDSDPVEAHWATCQLLEKGVVAVVGPSNALASEQVQSVTNRFRIPFIKMQWNFYNFASDFTLNLHPHYEDFGKAIHDYVKQSVDWNKNIAVIYSEEKTLVKFDYLFNKHPGDFIFRKWDLDSSDTKQQVIKFFHKRKDFTRFIVDIPYWEVANFYSQIRQYKMNTLYHSYLFTDLDFPYLNPLVFNSSIANVTGFSLLKLAEAISTDTNKNPRLSLEENYSYMQDHFYSPTKAALIQDSIKLLAHTIRRMRGNLPKQPQSIDCSNTAFVNSDDDLFMNLKQAGGGQDQDMLLSDFLTDRIQFSNNSRSFVNFSILGVLGDKIESIANWVKSDRKSDRTGLIIRSRDEMKMAIRQLIRGKVLRVTTFPEQPWCYFHPSPDDPKTPRSSDPKDWYGMNINIMNTIAERLGFNYTITAVPDLKYGVEDPQTGTWNGMIAELIEKRADIALASLTINSQRDKVISFTHPYMNLGVSILYRKPAPKAYKLFRFLEPFSKSVWGYVLTAYIMVSFVLYVIARFTPYEWYNPHPCNQNSEIVENNFSMLNSLWFMIGSLMQQGIDIVPRATSTRIIAGCWWFFTLIIISSYTANLAAFLTVERMKPSIESAEDLVKQSRIKYGTIDSGSTLAFFKDTKHETYKKMYEYFMKHKQEVMMTSAVSGAERVMSSTDYAFILESPTNNYYARRNCELMKIGPNLDSKGYGYGLPKGSPYVEIFSETILQLLNDQLIIKYENYWFGEFNNSAKSSCNEQSQSQADTSSLGFEQMAGCFMMVFLALILAFIVAFLEFLAGVYKITKTSKRPMREEMARQFRFAMSKSSKRNRTQEEAYNMPKLSAPNFCCKKNAGESVMIAQVQDLNLKPASNDLSYEQLTTSIGQPQLKDARIRRIPI